MSLITKFSSALSAFLRASAVKKSASLDPATWLRGDDIEDGEGAKLLSPYSQSAWVYIAISVLAENVAQIPFRISRVPASAKRDLHHSTTPQLHHSIRSRALGENIIESGPVVELFEHPHPTMDRA